MAAPNYYLGNVSDLASNMQSMFGSPTGGTGLQPIRNPGNNQTPGTIQKPQPLQPIRGPLQVPASQGQTAPLTTGSTSSPYPGAFNPMAAQAIRPTTFGQFDPSYGQNLATYIGNLFQRPQANQALQFNPYGNLTDANVPYPSVGGMPGLPQTLLAWAQARNPTNLSGMSMGGVNNAG